MPIEKLSLGDPKREDLIEDVSIRDSYIKESMILSCNSKERQKRRTNLLSLPPPLPPSISRPPSSGRGITGLQNTPRT